MTETIHQIKIGEMVIDVIRKDIKNLHLSVHPPTGRIRIASPLHIDDEAVRMFALTKLGWIKKHQAKLEAQPRQTKRQYIYRETHYFQGRAYLLHPMPSQEKPKVVVNHDELLLYIHPEATREQKEKVMYDWYRTEIKQCIPELIAKWEERMKIQVADWGVKRMRTHWGTCNIEERRIWINLELAKKSLRCLEYIIVHEMTHLLERHHNENFRFYMDNFMPNWKTVRDELNEGILGYEDWE